MTRNLNEFVNLKPIMALKPGALVGTEPADHVTILLGSYNGAAFLPEQLASLAHQSHRAWSLIASDDGSTDTSIGIVLDFGEQIGAERLTLQAGPQLGFAQNFLSLIRAAGPTTPYAAFCDQDDIWLPSKLERALSRLREISNATPAVYLGRTTIRDRNLKPLSLSPLFERPPSFENALVQSIAGGNTMVVNRAALDILQESSAKTGWIISHDWWIYQMIAGAGGKIIYDPEPMVHYRQHGANQVGANDGRRAQLRRLVQLLAGRFRRWNDANLGALQEARHWLSPKARETLSLVTAARRSCLLNRISLLKKAGIYRQTKGGNIALWLAAITRRL